MAEEHKHAILIVDDQPSARAILRDLLSNQGYNLILSSNGHEALEKATELEPDLILLDVMMPGMDGFEVCERLRTDPHLAEVPIIMITALDDRDARLRGLEVGVDDFITKPYHKTELQARVQTILRLNRYRKLMQERTHREEAEAAINRRNQELALLKEAEQIKDQFVSNVSHELRTPISVITLISGNLDALYDQLDDNKRRKMIKDIRRHIEVLDNLISDILEISRIDADSRSKEHHPLDLAQLVREEVRKLSPLAYEKNQQLDITNIDNLCVSGHDGQLRQILRNILNNAIKYTPDGGQITCQGYHSTKTQNNNGQWAAIEITDTGPGINQKDLPYLFERFYRVKQENSTPGTGLGLAIARELIELHNGHITVDSTPGKGSTFTIYLPLQE